MNVTGLVAKQLLNSNDPTPGTPRKGELFMSFLVIKNLADMCETSRSIINEMQDKRANMTGLPSNQTLKVIQNVLNEFYSDKMFIPDDKWSQRPDWVVIKKFNPENTRSAFQLYRIIRRNSQGADKMIRALEKRDKTFFLANIDQVFADLPMKDLISQFKNFIASEYVPKEGQELIWEYFEQLISLIQNESENIKLIESL
jgi:hypothetical protein